MQKNYFLGAVPCTRSLKEEETICEYEKNTGLVIAEAFQGKDPLATPGVLVRNHGPFTWGKSPYDAVYNAVVLEQIAFMNWHAEIIADNISDCPDYIITKHYYRKHGKNAYYGQMKQST